MAKTTKQEAKDALWRMGVLSFKLHVAQKDLYDHFYSSATKVQVWLLARRTGKSYALVVLALEQCIRHPNSIVKFLSPTKLQVNNNVRPLFRKILEDCPEDIRPEFNQKDYIYYFPNGSEIQLAGSDSGHAEKLRGGDSHIAFVDEAQSVNDLSNAVKSVLLPTTLMTKGKIILAGTSPDSPEHDFVDFIETAEARGSLFIKTIYDNPMLTDEEITTFIDEAGGLNSDECRRELFCELIRDPRSSVVPEFTKDLEKDIVVEWQRPPHFDLYEAMDVGFKDLTVVLFAYFDFRNNKVVIEDELVIDLQQPDNTITTTLIPGIREREHTHFYNHLTNEQKKPSKRISDIDHIVINEIKKNSKFEINFEVVKKDNLEAMVNQLREKLKSKEIIINPRCKTLLAHLRNVKWQKGEKARFARSDEHGHYDAVAAMIYLLRAIDYRRNPYPNTYGRYQQDLFGNVIAVKNPKKADDQMDVYRRIFNIKGKS